MHTRAWKLSSCHTTTSLISPAEMPHRLPCRFAATLKETLVTWSRPPPCCKIMKGFPFRGPEESAIKAVAAWEAAARGLWSRQGHRCDRCSHGTYLAGFWAISPCAWVPSPAIIFPCRPGACCSHLPVWCCKYPVVLRHQIATSTDGLVMGTHEVRGLWHRAFRCCTVKGMETL